MTLIIFHHLRRIDLLLLLSTKIAVMMLKKSTNGCCNYDDNFCTVRLQAVDEVYVALLPPLAVQSHDSVVDQHGVVP